MTSRAGGDDGKIDWAAWAEQTHAACAESHIPVGCAAAEHGMGCVDQPNCATLAVRGAEACDDGCWVRQAAALAEG